VISTGPPAGTSWPQTKPVNLTESAGIGLPDFTGQPRQVAEQWLQHHQLQVQEQPATSTTQPHDNVIKQSPAPNSSITRGEVTTLTISTGDTGNGHDHGNGQDNGNGQHNGNGQDTGN
jgi:eukaryotic-like serine/threonine-protein kinase